MTDLSKIPDLELRQKAKALNDRIDAIDAELEKRRSETWKKFHDDTAALDAERDKLDEQLGELLGEDHEITGTCDVTGLPIFDGDEVIEKQVLACVEA